MELDLDLDLDSSPLSGSNVVLSPLRNKSEYKKLGLGDNDFKSAVNNTNNQSSTLEDVGQDPEDNWPPLGIEIFQEWRQFLRLGVPGAASLFIEW